MPLVSARPLCGRIRRRDELRRDVRGGTKGRVVQRRQIFPNRACCSSVIVGRPLVAGDGALLVGIGRDQAGIDGKTLTANQAFRHAALDDALEQMAQDVAIAETAMPIAGECRMIRDPAVESKATEPAIGEIEMNLIAKTPLGPYAHAIADEQHPHHQFRINGRSTDRTLERPELLSHITEVQKTIDATQHMIAGNMIVQTEIVEQLRRSILNAHHRDALLSKSRNE